MQTLPSVLSLSWTARVMALLARIFRVHPERSYPPRPWADMKPIDYEGEDGSLTEKQIRLMK
jgi:hypothetical protein